MRRLMLLPLFALLFSCASGAGSVSELRWYDQPRSDVWQAALRAMDDIGANILFQSQSSGILTGTLNQVELGGQVRIDVSVRDSAGGGSAQAVTSDLRVSVLLEGEPNEDPELRRDLALIRDTYLEAVEHHLQLFERMRR